MKNTFKVLGIIALVSIIAFSFVACGGDDDSSGGNQGGNHGGNSGESVTYPDGMKDEDKPTDFSYTGKNQALTDYYTSPSSVTINNGKVNIILGDHIAPGHELWKSFGGKKEDYDGVTISPPDTRCVSIPAFTTVDQKYYLVAGREEPRAGVILFYVDKDVTLNGTAIREKMSPSILNFSLSLKKGWNYVVNNKRVNDQRDFNTATTKQLPSGFHWIVVDEEGLKTLWD